MCGEETEGKGGVSEKGMTPLRRGLAPAVCFCYIKAFYARFSAYFFFSKAPTEFNITAVCLSGLFNRGLVIRSECFLADVSFPK